LLEKSPAEYVTQRECFSCHHQALPLLALTTARLRGFAVSEAGLEKQVRHTAEFLAKNRDNYRQGRGQGGQADTAGYALLALDLAGFKPDVTTTAVAEYLLLRDKGLDHWRTSGGRPPSEASSFTTTYVALRGLRSFGTPDQKERITGRIDKTLSWLKASPAKDTEDRVFRLAALQVAGADGKHVQSARDELIKTQRRDGGWSQLDNMDSDAYATGAALVMLHKAGGLAVTDPLYQRGLRYLIWTQLADGSWRVRTRSRPFQTYFESGFPHGQDQFISITASSWATTALALACPPRAVKELTPKARVQESATPAIPTLSDPAWLVAPTENAHNLITCPGVTFDRSNNNVGIAIFADRLYVAIRSAPHHHPSPPAWAGGSRANGPGATKLYVMSTPFGAKERERVLAGWQTAWKDASWRLEFDAADRLEQEQLGPLRSSVSKPNEKTQSGSIAEVERLLGSSAARTAAKSPEPANWRGYLSDHDLREPLFFTLRGRLYLLFLSVAGVPHRFDVLRAWHTELRPNGTWDRIQPILESGDHFWDVHVSNHQPEQTAYLTMYHGGSHYSFTDSAEGFIDLRRSDDGRRWSSVNDQGFIDRGRGCEPALGFAPDGRAWILLRLEDADRRGWGSLLGQARSTSLDRWTFEQKADPQRFDSARFLSQGRDIYLIARQNIGTDAGGNLVETQNQPYDTTGAAGRPSNALSLGLMTRYGLSPKRTALYHLDPKAKRFRWLLSLPSAGDTAFPSFVRIAPDTILLANYSSPTEERNLSWLEGQNRRTGIYFMLMRFPTAKAP
jgi:hypothetical protein